MRFACIPLIFMLSLAAAVGYSDQARSESEELYEGRSLDSWISEVVGLAVKIRYLEEDYEKNRMECANQKPRNEKSQPCIQANQALISSTAARAEYQKLLDQISRTSLPQDWIRAHFTWVRWGDDWKRN